MPTIFHLDLDSFYVTAERLRNPALIGKPVAVGGTPPRGVISSASYEARKFGVRSAMPTAQAQRLCRNLIFVYPDHAYYSQLSKKVFALLDRFTPIYEVVSIDEAYFDMTGTELLFGPPAKAARAMKDLIKKETGLAASIGIATNRLVAKVATDQGKPDGLLEVPAGKEAEFLAPLPVRVLPGCGEKTQEWLRHRGIFTIADLQKFTPATLERELGGSGEYLIRAAWGKGSTQFNRAAKNPSSSRETTFDQDVADAEKLRAILWELVTDLGRDLRKHGHFGRTLRLKLRYPPFETVTRSRALKTPLQSDRALYQAFLKLFEENWDHARGLRLIGVACTLGDATHQPGLVSETLFDQPNSDLLGNFAPGREDPRRIVKEEKLDHLKDRLQKRFGERALHTGRDQKN